MGVVGHVALALRVVQMLGEQVVAAVGHRLNIARPRARPRYLRIAVIAWLIATEVVYPAIGM
jgi:hypothetical protein